MNVYVDTNVLIDFVADRKGFAESADTLFALGVTGKVKLMTSALSYVTAMYVSEKYEYENVGESLLAVSGFIEVLDLKASTVIEMLSSGWKDYEDATQNNSAVLAGADCIVTRNKKDFTNSSLQVYTPTELVEILENSK